jgi:hypothetical protein
MSRVSAVAIRAPRGLLNAVSVEVGVQGLLAGPRSCGVPDDQRRIDGDQAVAADVLPHRGPDAGVVLGGTDVQQPTVGIDHRHTGVVFLAPGKIEPNKVHGPTVPDRCQPRRR